MSDIALERHYTVQEVAEMWNLAYNTVLKLIEDEPGVLVFGSPETRYGRKRITRRIPESVMIRVHQKRMTK